MEGQKADAMTTTTTPARSRSSAERAKRRDRPAKAAEVKRAAVLSAEQIEAMLEAASPRDAALIALMTVGAMRVGEATLLTWDDVEDCAITIPGGITKTGVGRSFTLTATACRQLRAWREVCPPSNRGWIFPGIKGQCLSVRGAQTAISKLAAQLGLKGVSSHSFRRSALTAAHQAGYCLKAVAEISGHRSLASLEKYLDQDVAKAEAETARGLLLGD
jgi:integrase/recombinase XerD